MLPQLPARTLVVLAGRHAPAPAWSTDIEWAPLTRVLALRNLPPDESQSYLALRGVDTACHAQALAMTHGHPLALSLVADACARSHDAALDLDHEPDIVRTLLRKLFDDVPSAHHRLALDACATIPAMTEPALAAALGCDDAHAIFEWVAGLSFIEHGPRGLFPHDLAREVLYADSRWRNPELRRTLNARLMSASVRAIPARPGRRAAAHLVRSDLRAALQPRLALLLFVERGEHGRMPKRSSRTTRRRFSR